MRIAFDARPLLGPRTGVGVWLEGLLRALAAAEPWEFVLALPRAAGPLGIEDLGARVSRIASRVRLPGTVWLHTVAGPAMTGRADVFVGTLGVLPRRLAVPAVLVVHDLTPRTRPAQHTVANRFCFNAYVDESLAAADEVVCVSEATRARVAALAPAAGARARVIRDAVDPSFTPAPAGEGPGDARRRFAGGRPFVLQVGTLEPRKGVATLLAAHGRLSAEDAAFPDLVLAGGRGWGGAWLERALAEHSRPDRVHLPGYVAREDLVALYRHAEAVVVASEEEGFGLPLAEALACGAVCVASDEPALVEVAGGAARHVPRRDAAALARALREAVREEERARWRETALRRGAALGWGDAAAAWRELLVRLHGRMRMDAAPGR